MFGWLFEKTAPKETPKTETKTGLPSTWNMEVLKNIDWKLFEEVCSAYLDSKSWQVQQTELGADGGIDIVFNSENWSKPTPFGVIQCKARPNWQVPVGAIRELYGVMADRKAEIGIFITTGTYSQPARDFAAGKKMQLVDGAKFLGLIQSLKPEIQKALLERHITQDYSVPSCPSCGTKMVGRIPKNAGSNSRPFWGCPHYPKCHGKINMRADQAEAIRQEQETKPATQETEKLQPASQQDAGTKEKHGYCIRTGVEIPFNLKRPLSLEAYKAWSQYRNFNYRENFCHFSGEPSNGETSVNRPILKKNWAKAKEEHPN